MQKIFDEKTSKLIDVAKAIGIIAVVVGHYDGTWREIIPPHLFHMPLFFMIGGILAKETFNEKILKDTFFKYFLYILYTYIIISIAVILLSKIYPIKPGTPFITESVYALLFTPFKQNLHSSPYALSLWFLWAYMFVVVIGRYFISIIKNKAIILGVGLVLGYIGMAVLAPNYVKTKFWLFNTITQIFVGLGFYYIGYFIRDYLNKLKLVPLFLLSILVYFFHKNGIFYSTGMSWSGYAGNPIMILFCTSILCLFIFSLCQYLTNFKFLVYIGKYTKGIMSYHLLVFLMLTLIFKDDNFQIIDPLKNYRFEFSDFIYVSLGVFIPIMFNVFFEKYLRYIKNKISFSKG